MSTIRRIILPLIIFIFLILGCTTENTNSMKASKPYLGQTPPGTTSQVFAPGVVSLPTSIEYAATFSPDGTEMYFTRRIGENQNIYETHLVDDVWTQPTSVAFSTGYEAHEPHLTADNKTLYFGWFRTDNCSMEACIWAVDRTADGWSAPRLVGEGMFVSSSNDGQLFITNFAGGAPSLNKVTLTDGQFSDYKFIAPGVHPAIAPDGSYLVFDNGDGNLRVRFLLKDGKWSDAKDLTTQGIPSTASIASISPDGKYLFYVDNQDIYWVSTQVIKNLK
jgi:Tol biopolymer transport system component